MRKLCIFLIAWGLSVALLAQERQLQRWQYWFDQNQNSLTEKTLSGLTATINTTIDASGLSEGMHTLYLRIGDNENGWSPLHVFPVFVTPLQNRGEKTVTSVEYWVDDFSTRQTATISGGVWQQVFDAYNMKEGIHTLFYRFADNKAQYSPLYQAVFYITQKKATKVVKLRYWWSNRTDLAQEVDANSETFSYETLLSVPDYARKDELTGNGLARITIVAYNDQGRQSAPFYEDVIYEPIATILADKKSLSANETVNLTWFFNDAAGVRDYNVYYVKDDGPLILWLPSTTSNSAVFKGEKGVYRFFVVARNILGQRTSMDPEGYEVVTFE